MASQKIRRAVGTFVLIECQIESMAWRPQKAVGSNAPPISVTGPFHDSSGPFNPRIEAASQRTGIALACAGPDAGNWWAECADQESAGKALRAMCDATAQWSQ
jgi:hypothetical protein